MEKIYIKSTNEIVELVKEVAVALRNKGVDPVRTLTDYIRSGEPTYLYQIDKELRFKGKTVGVVDERGEIAAMYKGVAQNNIGIRTDVVDNMPKPEAMRILVRSMCPDVIACDEIGSMEDIKAIDYAMCSGVKGIFTAHGKDLDEINQNPELSKLLSKHTFERIILLNPEKRGDAKCIYL
jgi:stage III sporulation protein AA